MASGQIGLARIATWMFTAPIRAENFLEKICLEGNVLNVIFSKGGVNEKVENSNFTLNFNSNLF